MCGPLDDAKRLRCSLLMKNLALWVHLVGKNKGLHEFRATLFAFVWHGRLTEMARRAHEAGSMADKSVFHVNVNKLANKVCGLAFGQRDRLTSTQRAVLTTTQEIIRASLRRSMDAGDDLSQSRSESKRDGRRPERASEYCWQYEGDGSHARVTRTRRLPDTGEFSTNGLPGKTGKRKPTFDGRLFRYFELLSIVAVSRKQRPFSIC